MKLALPFSLFSLVALSGCGKFLDQFSRLPSGFTNVVFNRASQSSRDLQLGLLGPESFRSATSVLFGGALIYAHNVRANLTVSGTLADENGILSLALPNGDYTFSAFGWPTANLSDTTASGVRCGTAAPLTLSGQAQDVSFNLASPTGCATSTVAFAPPSAFSTSPTTIRPITLSFCNGATNVAAKTASSSCSGIDSSSNFYAGEPNHAKIDRAFYYPSGSTFLFTATHDSSISAPYELFRYERSSGKQTKLPLPITGGSGVSTGMRVPNKNKLLFVLVRNSGTVGELWSYDLATNSLHQVSQTPVGGTVGGVREFRISENGNWVVFVGDMDTSATNELYAVPIPADGSNSYAAPVKISDSAAYSTGVQHCTSCAVDAQYYFEISRGLTNNYVAYSSLQSGTPILNVLRLASLDGTAFPTGSVNGTGITSAPTGIVISGSEISAAADFIDFFDFSPNGHQLIYHAHSGSSEKAMVAQVSYVPNTSLTVPTPAAVVSDLTYPFFLAGNSTAKAFLFEGSNPSGNNTSTTVSVLDLTGPSLTNLFQETGASLQAVDFDTTDDDSNLIVAFGTPATTPTSALEILSVPTNPSGNYDSSGGHSAPLGASVSYTGGLLTSGQLIKPIDSGSGHHFFRPAPGAGNGLIFISDLSSAGIFHLWQANYGQTAHQASGSLVTSGNPVVSAGYGGDGNIYFAANLYSAGNELFLANVSSEATRLNSRTYTSTVNEVADTSDLSFGAVVAVEGASLDAPGVSQSFLYVPATGNFTRIGVIGAAGATTPAVSGVGRVRITMLKSADGIGFGPAFDSGCLSFTGTGFDGGALTTNVRVPMGAAGGPSPFATLVEVFPLALNCAGPAQKYSFPNGLGAVFNASSGSANLTANTLSTVLFLQDQ